MIHLKLKQQLADFTLDLDLTLPARGVSAIVGPSGSGKTTLLRCVAGLEKADQALIEINGNCWQDSQHGLWLPPHKRALGYVFQEASLFDHLSVHGNLDYGRRRSAEPASDKQAAQIIELLGIGHLLQRSTTGLSGGERQRVGIARALLTNPRLLLLDEPLTALDPQRKADILPYLERLHAELDIPLLYVSHSPDEVARLADHLVLLENGTLRASGPLQTLLPRLDLPMAHSDDARSVLHGQVSACDDHYQLLELTLAGSVLKLRVPHAALPLGQQVRVAVQARDVSLALEKPQHSSVLNQLPARIEAIEPGNHPAQTLVRLALGDNALLARVTRYSADQLQLQPGLNVWVQIKAVALFD
ncbi:MAG: molybdenum ABC transporter ATP-binding protein [Pseudomonas sp.]|nr:molybdenum ABC transporter ATP-binding protein [Pseudomonas sp.]MBB52059.1 molybdenum ABC transporter ATP-binding protein [Pseudomonadales bacterium]